MRHAWNMGDGELMLGIEITRLRAEQEGNATVGCHQQKQLICHQQVLYAVDYVDYVDYVAT